MCLHAPHFPSMSVQTLIICTLTDRELALTVRRESYAPHQQNRRAWCWTTPLQIWTALQWSCEFWTSDSSHARSTRQHREQDRQSSLCQVVHVYVWPRFYTWSIRCWWVLKGQGAKDLKVQSHLSGVGAPEHFKPWRRSTNGWKVTFLDSSESQDRACFGGGYQF